MKEREIKDRIRGFIDQVDQRTVEALRQGVRKIVLPAALGMGLALGSGCGGEESFERPTQTVQQGKSDHLPGEVVALYAAPFPEPDAGVGPAADASEVVALYAAPFPEPDAGADPAADAGEVVALYAAPFPESDAGAAPAADAGEVVALYAAPFPESDAGEAPAGEDQSS